VRYSQAIGSKGSQKHFQQLVNDSADRLGNEIRQLAGFEMDEEIIWKSPIADHKYAEYRDKKSLEVLGMQEATKLHSLTDFWPLGGPQWDALAQTNKQKNILVEAKSHIGELKSTCGAKNPASIQKIQKALNATKAYFGSNGQNDWSIGYYQYANRLAHLYWLRAINSVDAHLVFVYFVNDTQMKGSQNEWKTEIAKVHAYLGLNSLPDYVHDVFIEVSSVQIVSSILL